MTQKEVIEIVSGMSNQQQNEFYDKLRENGFLESEIQAFQAVVFFDKLFNNPVCYNAVRNAMAESIYKEFTK